MKIDWKMPEGNWTEKSGYYKKFADVLIKIYNQIPMKISSRGWCYQLEGFGVITKNQFDKIQGKIVECVKKGFLPMDFVAEDISHEWLGVENPEKQDYDKYLKEYLEREIENAFYYTPDWWKNEEYYIQMVVEKVDLITLFKPICDLFHIPITNARGTGSVLQRGLMAERFKQAEEKGLKCVLLYCGDHDPDGLRMGDNYKKLLNDIKDCWLIDGFKGYNPENLIPDRFGLNADWINKNNLTWLNNLMTGAKKGINDLANPEHKNHNQLYIQNYIKKFGVKKCEANALVVIPEQARQLCRDSIEYYLGKDAEERFKKIKKKNKSKMKKMIKKLKGGEKK